MTERNGVLVLGVLVVLGWIGQLIGAVIHGGIDGSTYTWFARVLWLGVTIFTVSKYLELRRNE